MYQDDNEFKDRPGSGDDEEATGYDEQANGGHSDPTQMFVWQAPSQPELISVSSQSAFQNDYAHQNTSAPPPPPSLAQESAARERVRRRRASGQKKGGEWAWVVIAVAMLGVVITISLSVFLVLRGSQSAVDVLPTAEVALSVLPTPMDFRTTSDTASGAPGETMVLNDGTSIVISPWDGQSRLTVLVMGLDRRPGETGLAFRTDTMLLMSIDPATNQIGILSIPRDLYVPVPGYNGLRRINEPMVLGELYRSGYGPTLAMQTVQNNLGIRVNHYLAVDFRAFIAIVDAIGGIEVEIDYSINDPRYPSMNYGYDPFYLRAGRHVLDGENALKFARTRHGDNDIRRAERQQMVLFSIQDKVARLDMLPQLIVQAPTLLQTFQENFYTDLTLEQMVSLALYVKDISRENITTGVIDYSYARSWTTPEGWSVLIPMRAQLGQLMAQVFGADYSS